MATRIYLNENWLFSETFLPEMLTEKMSPEAATEVRLPHTVKETPYHYFDASIYEMVSCYQLELPWQESYAGKALRLTVEAAGHVAELYLNGELLAEHRCGYTAFTVDLTGKLNEGDNLLTIKLDSHESLNIPPFGHVIDYMTYGGLYREVYLDVSDPCYIQDVFPKVTLTDEGVLLSSDIYVSSACGEEDIHVVQSIYSLEGRCLAQMPQDKSSFRLKNVSLWSPEHPQLYVLKTELLKGEQIVDCREDRIGFREAVFKQDGFYLNGEKYKIRGVDRHQSYPYVGYAMPESMQKYDVELLKNELGLNAVRTSHYPQSQHFLNWCDELGLLVFTELPGWQHIGDEEWKDQAVENVREMVLQYRNHPSIILWGVRINESLDDDEFYTRTNALAHLLDPTRQTSGVRYLQKSSLLEDVYAFNDFSFNGETHGCLPRSEVTPDMEKGYLISEYNGHMFPTKNYDCEDHRTEHMLRHATVVDAYYGEEDIAGGFAWCMFDYNTHKDFGSGDRMCYHGVMDMFRNRKLAGYLYAAQQADTPVLEISSSMDIGEHPGGLMRDVYAITNADSVRLYKNGVFIKEFQADNTPYHNMPHGPILIDDFVGSRIEEEEGLPHHVAEDIKAILMAANKFGINSLPDFAKELEDKCVEVHGLPRTSILEYYNKYIGNWGGHVTTYRFDAIKNGHVVRSVLKKPMDSIVLKAEPSHTVLQEGTTYDVAAVRIQALSDCGNLLNYYQEPVFLSVSGDLQFIGPNVISLKGGTGGTYVKTTGKGGIGQLTITGAGFQPVTINFRIEA